MKSQAVFSLGGGMPGVSGEEKVKGRPTAPGLAKLPGVVPCWSVDGLSPRRGRVQDEDGESVRGMATLLGSVCLARARRGGDGWDELFNVRIPYAGTSRIRFQGVISDPAARCGGSPLAGCLK